MQAEPLIHCVFYSRGKGLAALVSLAERKASFLVVTLAS
jgi:hypothetical protein